MRKAMLFGLMAALVAVLGVVGAGAASATVLCKNEECTETYPVGTKMHAEQVGTSVFKNGSEVVDECSESVIEGELENAGGSTQTPAFKVQGQTWTICKGMVITVKKGVIELHVIIPKTPPIKDFTITGSNGEVTIDINGVSCNYTTAAGGTDLGIYTGGNFPSLDIKAKTKKSAGSFLCPAEVTWEAEYKATSPAPLYGE